MSFLELINPSTCMLLGKKMRASHVFQNWHAQKLRGCFILGWRQKKCSIQFVERRHTAPTSTTSLFNPAAIDLNDLVALQSLKCPELNKVVKFHNQKAAGTNEAIVKCLRALAMSTPLSSAPIPPPPPVLAAPIPPSSRQSPVSASILVPPQPTVNPYLNYPYYYAPTHQYPQF
ncbi:hypothetical protein K443DRAFT_8899 [Laccaria amethystina LaAM-08-1]|uniref:Uncharacterized protein n=1 Tax=Laccaria amethystina LaAM-08-1 TaxID=1095629 RepID=A0A0C9XBB3_9AGAR|nr:hypothetical protein K443DRAFT_8899 [Laccaria amethystina LaAM-08-1]